MAMKSYRSYMDCITVSDGLHEKLMGLEGTPARRKAPLWLRTGALAACAVLLVGVGVYGIIQLSGARLPAESERESLAEDTASSSATIAPAPEDDLALEDPDNAEPGQKLLGGYETHEVRANVPVNCYYMLPWIDYGKGGNAAAASLEWDFPPDAIHLTLSSQQIAALLGGENALQTHLDWNAYTLTGRAAWNADGTFIGAYIQGYEGPLDHWEFTVWAGKLPPACIVLENSVEQTIWDTSVTADKFDGKNGVSRNVSFMAGDYGYRFSLTATDAGRAELLVSRLVRYMIMDDGVRPEYLSPEGDIHLPPVQDPVTPQEDAAPEEGNTAAFEPPVPNTAAPEEGSAASRPPETHTD